MIPKISLIIPVFNVEKYLKQCLDSAINQTFTDIEIIVVNDGSTDNSKDIIEDYKKNDSRIILINQEHHGPGYARNTGLNIARGEYILFIDSDDWIKEETSQKLYDLIKRDEDLDLVIFQYINYDEKKDIFYEEKFDSKLNKFIDKTLTFKEISNCYLAPTCAMKLYRKSLIENNNIRFPEETFYEDKPFHTEIMLQFNKAFFTDKAYYIRRRRQGSITSKADKKIFDSIEISNLVVEAYKNNDKYQKYINSVINNKISYLRYCYRIILDQYKQEYLNLIAKDFDKIRSNKVSYEEYLNCLDGINREFFINVKENIKFQDLDYLLSNYKIQTKIIVNPIKPTRIGDKTTITGILTDIKDNPLPNTQLKILTDNSQKTIKTNNEGNFTTKLKTNKKQRSITIQYQGNNTYQKTTTTTNIEINKIKTKITAKAIKSTKTGEKTTITGTLTDNKDNPLPNTQLKILTDNSQKTIKTNNEGNFTTKLKTNKKQRSITIQYQGNNTYQKTTTTTDIEIKKIKTKITLKPVKKIFKGEEIKLNGTLTDIKDNPLPNLQIKILINNSPKTIKADENGNFNYTYKMNKTGTNDINIIFNGNNTHQKTSLSIKPEVINKKTNKIQTKIIVNPIKPTRIGDKTTITGTLTDNKDNPLPNTQLKILTDNSQKTIKTNNEGNFTTKLKTNKKQRSITIQYQGNNTYQKTTTTTNIQIKKIESKIIMEPIEKVIKGEEVCLNGTLATLNNNIIPNVQIKILINNSPKTLKIDDNGKFSFTYKMNRVGINDIDVIFNGNNTYDKCNFSMKLEVFK